MATYEGMSPELSGGHDIVLRVAGHLLSAPVPDDAAAIAQICQDPAVVEWTTVPSPYGLSDAEAFIVYVNGRGRAGLEYTWAIRRSDGGELVGMVGLDMQPAESAVVGYYLAPQARGEGLMAKVLRAVIDYGFDPEGLALKRLEWGAYVGNLASLRVAMDCGFHIEGEVRGHSVQRGVRRDSWIGTLLVDDPR